MKASCLVLAVFLAYASALPDIDLHVKSRQTDSITVQWNVTDVNNTVESYKVYVDDMTDSYHITYQGETLVDSSKREATLVVHEPDTPYNVCVIAVLTHQTKMELNLDEVATCVIAATIIPMQLSSILALIGVLGFFLACFVIGYCAWKCAAKGKGDDLEYEKSDVNGNGDIVPLTQIED